MKPALLVADVDGTLVTKTKALAPGVRDAVRALARAGVRFTLVSGRLPRGLEPLVAELEVTAPFAAFSGGMLLEPDLTPIRTLPIDPAAAARAVALLESHDLDVWVYTAREWVIRDAAAPFVAHEAETVRLEPVVVDRFDAPLEGALKIVGVSPDADRVARAEAAVRAALGAAVSSHEKEDPDAPPVSAARSWAHYLDVTHRLANKGEVVEQLARRFGIKAAQIVTIGDQPVDVPMFERSGLGIAMGNASEEVQRAADFVTASNEEDGFAKAVRRILADAL